MKSNFKWILPYAFPVKGLLFLTTLFMVIESLANLAAIGLQQSLIDDVLLKGEYHLVTKIIILIVVAFFIHSIMFTIGPHFIHLSVAAITEHTSKDFINYMYKIPTRRLQQKRTGSFVHNIVFDAEQIAVLLGNDLPRIIMELTSLLLLFYIIGKNSLAILLFSVIAIIAYILLGHRFTKKVKEAAKDVQSSRSELIVHMEEGISSTREVIAYHRIKWEKAIYDRVFKKYFRAVMQEGKVVNVQIISSEPIKWGVILFILIYGGYLVMQGNMSLGTFVIIYQFSNQLVAKFQSLFYLSLGLSEKTACVERVRAVIDEPTWSDGNKEITDEIHSLELDNIEFAYNEESEDLVLKNINVSIPIGKKVAFVGSSGGGKSTIAQLLIRLFEPIKGHILVNNLDLTQIRRNDWTKRVSIVFQESYLYPDSIRNNIMMGHEVSDERLIEVCKIAQIHDYIISLAEGYDTVIGERGVTLSGGQRQRIAIVRALIQNPEILILDEATSALDLITENKLQQAVDGYRQGKTTIIIAHRLSTIQNADRIFVLDKGLVIEEGSHIELLKGMTKYKSLVMAEHSQV